MDKRALSFALVASVLIGTFTASASANDPDLPPPPAPSPAVQPVDAAVAQPTQYPAIPIPTIEGTANQIIGVIGSLNTSPQIAPSPRPVQTYSRPLIIKLTVNGPDGINPLPAFVTFNAGPLPGYVPQFSATLIGRTYTRTVNRGDVVSGDGVTINITPGANFVIGDKNYRVAGVSGAVPPNYDPKRPTYTLQLTTTFESVPLR